MRHRKKEEAGWCHRYSKAFINLIENLEAAIAPQHFPMLELGAQTILPIYTSHWMAGGGGAEEGRVSMGMKTLSAEVSLEEGYKMS